MLKRATSKIKSLASELFKLELDRERIQRKQRRHTVTVPVLVVPSPVIPGRPQYFRQEPEQQNTENSIHQSNQTDTCNFKYIRPLPVPPTTSSPEEREKSFVSPQSDRRGFDEIDVPTLSADHRDDPGSFGRSHHASVHERAPLSSPLPENWVASETVEELGETTRLMPQRRESQPIPCQISFTRQPHVDLDDDDDEREIGRGGGGRDGERHWEYDRDRDRDGGRDIHSNPRRSATFPYSASRHPPRPNPSPGGSSRPTPLNVIYEGRESVPGSNHGKYNNYQTPPPDILEYQRRPVTDSTRRGGPGFSCQSSYGPPRDDYTGDNGL